VDSLRSRKCQLLDWGGEPRVLGEGFLGLGGRVRGFGCGFFFPEEWVG